MEIAWKMMRHPSINMSKKYTLVVDDLLSRDMQKLVWKY